MVKAKLTRADGSTLELEGTSEEVAAVLAWERPAQPAQLQPIILPIPYQPPAVPYAPIWPAQPWASGTADPLPPLPVVTCADAPAVN